MNQNKLGESLYASILGDRRLVWHSVKSLSEQSVNTYMERFLTRHSFIFLDEQVRQSACLNIERVLQVS